MVAVIGCPSVKGPVTSVTVLSDTLSEPALSVCGSIRSRQVPAAVGLVGRSTTPAPEAGSDASQTSVPSGPNRTASTAPLPGAPPALSEDQDDAETSRT